MIKANRLMFQVIGVFVVLMFLLPTSGISQVRGITKDTVKVGAYQPLTGILAAEAKQVTDGVRAYFSHINDGGGVNGRKIEYLVENDNYDPQQAVAAAKKLVERDQIFAMVAPLGTVTGMAVLPYLIKQNVPLVTTLSGSKELLDSKEPLVFGVMLVGNEAGEAAVEWAIGALKPQKAAIFFQNDKFGKDGKDGIEQTLRKRGIDIVAIEGHLVTDTDLSSVVVKMRQANPDTVFMYTIPKPAAMFLKEAQKMGWKPNFVGCNPIAHPDTGKLAGEAVNGLKVVFYTALGDSTNPLVAEKVKILKKYAPDTTVGYYAFHGMVGATLMVEGLKRAGNNPTVESFIKGMETLKDFDIGLVPPITYAPGKHRGSYRFAAAEWRENRMVIIKNW